jgi:type II secretion system protein G
MKFFARGFTLVELMVVVAIMAILAAIVYSNIGGASPKARDAERQADIRNLQTAIEQYKLKNGRYPAMGCTPGGDQISAEDDCITYVADLAPAFITVLPKDTKRGTAPGYSYVTNTDGTSYKVMAQGTVESETVTSAHSFKRCENSGVGICTATIEVCSPSNASYQNTYAVWGGFADGSDDDAVKTATALVICK